MGREPVWETSSHASHQETLVHSRLRSLCHSRLTFDLKEWNWVHELIKREREGGGERALRRGLIHRPPTSTSTPTSESSLARETKKNREKKTLPLPVLSVPIRPTDLACVRWTGPDPTVCRVVLINFCFVMAVDGGRAVCLVRSL